MRRAGLASLAIAALTATAGRAHASGPLEYPDNGSASFSRGGAWLATATDPIAAHYNPAGLVTQSSGASLEMNFAFNKVCFDRRNPGDAPTGPNQATNDTPGTPEYRPACNNHNGYPRFVPSAALAYRYSETLAFGFAIVPPAAYGTAEGEWSPSERGVNPATGEVVSVPSPYRFMTVGNNSTILFPTLSAATSFGDLRVGAGFIWGFALIDVESFGISRVSPLDQGDHLADDSRSRLKTDDLFMPGFVLGTLWSATPNIDVAGWFRWVDYVRTTQGEVDITTRYYVGANPPKKITGDDFRMFEFPLPPELRLGVRFHVPRAKPGPKINPSTFDVEPEPSGFSTRDPLRDDVFDVELNGSYTFNAANDRIKIRFIKGAAGEAVRPVDPGYLPPNADRPTGYKDSIGIRLGAQYNAIANKLGLRAGTWVETAAADDAYLNVSPVPALRGGYGGGVVLRQNHFDFQLGYQYHWSAGMDNHGNGALRAGAGVRDIDAFRLGQDPLEQQFRSYHSVNGGRVTQSAHVFTLGGIYRF